MTKSSDRIGVSFVVPVHNGSRWIAETLASIVAQADGRPMEVVVVNDDSRDDSLAVLQRLSAEWPLQVIPCEGRGAAAAINTGVRAARFPIICQVDQDVVLKPGWMQRLVVAFDDPEIGAAQGYYETDRSSTLCARIMGLDLEQRYAAIRGRDTDHVCTGNSAYRAEALHRAGLFDASLGYGYDNDISYRLREAGYRLAFVREARSVHRWRTGLSGYFYQQYGFGYGRLDVVAKHPYRLTGDAVSPAGMMAHPLLMAAALAGFACAAIMAVLGGPWRMVASASGILVASLALERLAAGVVAARRFRQPAALLFPAAHLLRDLAWVAALVTWSTRRALQRPSLPAHSMRPGARPAEGSPSLDRPARWPVTAPRTICVIPAFNEADNLPAVIGELRVECPGLDIVVIDDGSTDDTASVAAALDVPVIQFRERLGIGNAVRAGLRYAVRAGYGAAVRIDGDGQHRAGDIAQLLGPILEGRVDVVFGSRYTAAGAGEAGAVRVFQRLLALCLSTLTGRLVTDPTSGFCAFGRRSLRLLAQHHPTGYPEPELLLLLSRCGLSVIETPVGRRSRLGGHTSLTPSRVIAATARVMLAMIIVPLRRPTVEAAGD